MPSTLGVVPWIVRPGPVKIHFTDDGAGTPLLLHTGSGGDGSMWSAPGTTTRSACDGLSQLTTAATPEHEPRGCRGVPTGGACRRRGGGPR